MKIAILGGTRFIGPLIVRGLLRQGHEVDVYHRGITTCDFAGSVHHITINRMVPGQTAAAIGANRPDVIIDMCGFHAEEVKEAITASSSLQQYVFCSSTSVYGKIGNKAVPDETAPLQLKNEYERGKAACEEVLLSIHKSGNTTVTILRLAHPYGPGDNLLYSTGREGLFLDRIRQGRPIVIPGNGDTRIHPIYVADAAQAFVHVVGRPDCSGRIFNLAGENILSFDEYFGSVARGLDCPLHTHYIQSEWFDAHEDIWANRQRNFKFAPIWCRYESAFDVTALFDTGFRCQTNHDQGVAATIAWLNKNAMIPPSSDHDLEDIVIDKHAENQTVT